MGEKVLFSTLLLRQVRPEVMTVGDGTIDVHVDVDGCPAGRYWVREFHEGYVVAERGGDDVTTERNE